MGNNDTPVTGTAIPRPFRRAEPPPPSEPPVTVSFPPPPLNPTMADIYALIDARLSPKIIERISSVPAPAPKPVHSIPVRAAKFTGKWYAYLVAGGISLIQAIAAAALPEYRGPIVQAAKLAMLIVAEVFKDDPTALPSPATPELLPEPVSPMLPAPRPPLVHEPDLAPPPGE